MAKTVWAINSLSMGHHQKVHIWFVAFVERIARSQRELLDQRRHMSQMCLLLAGTSEY